MTSKRAMRCFRHSPYRGADERVLRCFGHQRELSEFEYINPTRTWTSTQLYHSFISTRQLAYSIIFLLKHYPHHYTPEPTTEHTNTCQQCRAVNPRRPRSSRLRADARKSRSIIRSSQHPHRLPWLTLSSSSFVFVLDSNSASTAAAPSALPSPAPKPVRALDNAPVQGARTGRPRR
jgi:hypothetical protein